MMKSLAEIEGYDSILLEEKGGKQNERKTY